MEAKQQQVAPRENFVYVAILSLSLSHKVGLSIYLIEVRFVRLCVNGKVHGGEQPISELA